MSQPDEHAEEFMRGAVEGECRARLQCNLCGRIDEVRFVIDDVAVRDQFQAALEEAPEDVLEGLRAAAAFANGWGQLALPDGSVLDFCADCAHSDTLAILAPH
jgi:hypothetical protein